MKQQERKNIPERLGRWAGKVRRGYARREASTLGWLCSKGVPVALSRVFLWAIKLALVGTLLYAAFWIAIVVLSAVVVIWLAKDAPSYEPPGEWRSGDQGYGYYEDGTRTDCGRFFDQDDDVI